MTGWMWALATVGGPIVLGLALLYLTRQSATFSRDKKAVRRQQEGVRRLYGRDAGDGPLRTVDNRFVGRKRHVYAISIATILIAAGATWYLTRISGEPPPRGSINEAGPPAPTIPGSPDGAPKKEATCRTTPQQQQAGMQHAACAWIASQIPVLAQDTSDLNRTSSPATISGLKPGMDMPSDVRELLPLPQAVTDRYPSLRGQLYFLAGQNIVVVGDQAKIEFVIDVNVRP
ncbi:MAG: hypothetical protein NW223_15485 [Hyphomicrobiaceae bacterium]|nr:hypothetical protein [Hyphomicrobiaceae bacterium]